MTELVVADSVVESDRFGRRMGRLDLGSDIEVDIDRLEAACEGYDIVIVRFAADRIDLPFRLLHLHGLRAVTVDHLSVWRWDVGEPDRIVLPDGWSVGSCADPVAVESVVRDAFANYRNHYRANPLLDAQAALDGYVEWAHTLMARGPDACAVVCDPTVAPVGIALTDWDDAVPNVKLAGMRSRAQGQGRYAALLSYVMQLTVERSRPALTIATQSHNVNVMRAWVRLGFLPVDTVATVHLVRRELVDSTPVS